MTSWVTQSSKSLVRNHQHHPSPLWRSWHSSLHARMWKHLNRFIWRSPMTWIWPYPPCPQSGTITVFQVKHGGQGCYLLTYFQARILKLVTHVYNHPILRWSRISWSFKSPVRNNQCLLSPSLKRREFLAKLFSCWKVKSWQTCQ